MPLVSAYYAPPSDDPIMRTKAGDPQRVIAIDDQGVEWHLTDDSQVGDWLRFIESGGQVMGAKPAPAKKADDKPAAKPAKRRR
jgi:hypothetical protein